MNKSHILKTSSTSNKSKQKQKVVDCQLTVTQATATRKIFIPFDQRIIFFLNFVIEASILSEYVGQFYFGYLKGTVNGLVFHRSLFFPGISTDQELLLLNMFLATVTAMGALPSLYIVYAAPPRKQSEILALSSILYNISVILILLANFFQGGKPIFPELIGMNAKIEFQNHVGSALTHFFVLAALVLFLHDSKILKKRLAEDSNLILTIEEMQKQNERVRVQNPLDV